MVPELRPVGLPRGQLRLSFEFWNGTDWVGGAGLPARGRDRRPGALREPERGGHVQAVLLLQQHRLPERVRLPLLHLRRRPDGVDRPDRTLGVLDVLQLGPDTVRLQVRHRERLRLQQLVDGFDNFNIDGPCESASYNWSSYPDFSVEDDTGSAIDDDTQTSNGTNTVTLSADNLQDGFPYAAELKVYYDGYLNFFESQMVIVDNATSTDLDFEVDVPGFVCDVHAGGEALRQDQHLVQQRAEQTYVYADGPCDGTEGRSQLSVAALREHRRLVGPGRRRHGDPSGNHRDVLRHQLDGRHGVLLLVQRALLRLERLRDCRRRPARVVSDPQRVRVRLQHLQLPRQYSEFSGWHYYEYTYLYPDTDCIEEAGEMSLGIQGDDGNWTSYDSNQGYDYHLEPGTTSMAWNVTGLLEGYEYEFYWYVNSEYYCESLTRGHTSCTPTTED